MSQLAGIAINSLGDHATVSLTTVSDQLGQPQYANPTEHRLSLGAANELIGALSKIASSASVALTLPVSITDAQKKAITDAASASSNFDLRYTIDHSTAYWNFLDVDTSTEKTLNILFIDLNQGQVAAKLTSVEIEDGQSIITPEEKTILGAVDVSTAHDLLNKLVDPTVPSRIDIHRIIIFGTVAAPHEISSALQARFPNTQVQWASLADLSRGAATAVFRQPRPIHSNLVSVVVPLPIGLATADGHVAPAIARNTFLPYNRSVILTTSRDNQTTATLQFVTGTRALASDNIQSGKIVLEGLTSKPKGTVRIKVSFEIDESGEVKVNAGEGAISKTTQLPNILKYSQEDLKKHLPEQGEIYSDTVAPAHDSRDEVVGELPE